MDQIKDNKESAPLLKYLSITAFFIAVIILGFWLTRPLTKTKIEISRVGEKANVIHGGKLRIGDSIQTEKVTHFEFIDGSKIKLLGELEVKSAKVIYLKSGEISVNAVPQGDEKLTLITDHAKSAVFGSSFTVKKLIGETILDVSEGKVEFDTGDKKEIVSGGLTAITYKGDIISSTKGVGHVKFLVYKRELTSDSSLKFFAPFENQDPLKIIAYPGKSLSFISGKFVNGRKPFVRALENGTLEIKGSESFNLNMPCTVGAWVKVSEFKNYPSILTKGNNAWRIQMNINGKRIHCGFGNKDQFINGKKFVELNQWIFITFVGTGNKVKVYVNGELENEQVIDAYNLNNDSAIMIGGNKIVPEQSFSGQIGNTFILEREMSHSEVKSIYDWYK